MSFEKMQQLQDFIDSRLFGAKTVPNGDALPKQEAGPIFILCPARSGSTLLRVLLAGAADLFAPPELELLSFDTMKNRQQGLSLRLDFMLSGLVRAVMALKDCDAETATALLKKYEEQGTTMATFYAELQGWCGPRRLVDKSVHYAMSTKILERSEQFFENATYIHLSRHPYGTIDSMVSLEVEKELYGPIKGYSPQELAEYTWQICHQNILSFLENVPKERQIHIRFEDLVAAPKNTMLSLCDFLKIPFQQSMLQPYQDKQGRMTDEAAGTKMVGDPNFHNRKKIDAEAAHAWKKVAKPRELGKASKAIAQKLNYKLSFTPKVSEEDMRLLESWNDTAVDFPADKTIVDLFEEQVLKTPDNIALIFENKELTYRELNEKANIVGHYLRANYNIQADDIIALQLERSEWMIIAILGVMKSGAAYLPIAPDFPEERVSYMLKDSRARLLLTDEETYATAKAIGKAILPVLVIEQIKNNKQSNPKKITGSKDLAYIIYTSGSTGLPKGTMLAHQGPINLAYTQIRLFDVSPADNFFQFANYTFDAMVGEILATFFSGARLIMAKKEHAFSPSNFLALIKKHQVSIAVLPPIFLSNLDKKSLSSLRILVTAGASPVLEEALYYNQELKYFNGYGPTEYSVCTSMFQVPKDWNKPFIPIGKPIDNTQVFILNKELQLLPINSEGELCVAGVGMARGYLNNPELTAEKFVPHPFKKGERLYRTGDLARWLPCGNLEFLGRIDQQLKIRGYRIEAGDIVQILLAQPTIQSAAVIGYQGGNKQEKELVAYLVAKQEESLPDISTLRSFLAKSLPGYMIPSFFVELDEMPLTPSGKINRKALPPPDETSLQTGTTYEAPRNSVETTLVEIWEKVLERTGIGVHDNFFELGGHSLRAIQMAVNMSEAFFMDIPAKLIFQSPTIDGLAKKIGEYKYGDYHYDEGIIFNPNTPQTLFVFPIIFGLGIDYEPLSKFFPAITWYCFDFLVPENRLELYYQQIKQQQPTGPYVFFGHSVGGSLAFEMARFMEAKGEIVSDLILGDTLIRLVDKGFDFQAYLEEFFAHWIDTPLGKQLSLLLQNEMFYKNTEARLNGYNDFVNEISMEKPVKATIHQLLATEDDGQDKSKVSRNWSVQTTGKFLSYELPGGHGSIFESPHVEKNVLVMKDILNRIHTQMLVI